MLLSTYPTTLSTKRLFLRILDCANDADCLTGLEIVQDSGGVQNSGHERLNLKSLDHYRRKNANDAPRQELCTRAVAPANRTFLVYEGIDDSTISIGQISMSFRSDAPYPDLGYHMREAFIGKGYATEASRAVLAWWQDVIGVKEIWLGMLQENGASERIAQKLGFELGGTLEIAFLESTETVAAKAYILPGMTWPSGVVVHPSSSNA